MKAAIASAFVAAALITVPAPARAAVQQTPAVASADHNLDERIEKRIDTSTLKKYNVKVSVTNGVATLTGTVATEADRAKATQLATIPGISRVENQLIVDLSAPTGTAGVKAKTKDGVEKTKEGAEKLGDKTKSGAEKVADKTKEGLSKTGEVITDGWISTRIKTKFMGDEDLRASDIKVDTNDNVVTLSGAVADASAHSKAIAMAEEVEGVKRVVDKLVVAKR